MSSYKPILFICLLAAFCLLSFSNTHANNSRQTLTVNSTEDTSDMNVGDGVCADYGNGCTLRAAIEEANALAGLNIITLPAGTYTRTTLQSDGGEFLITDDLIIEGASAKTTFIDANEMGRHIILQSGVSLELSGVRLSGGHAIDGIAEIGQCLGGSGGSGGAIFVREFANLTLRNTYLTGNRAGDGADVVGDLYPENSRGGDGGAGGAIFLDYDTTLTVTNSTIADNALGTHGMGNGGDGYVGDGRSLAFYLAESFDTTSISIDTSTVSDLSTTVKPTGEGSGCNDPFSPRSDSDLEQAKLLNLATDRLSAEPSIQIENSTIGSLYHLLFDWEEGRRPIQLSNTILETCSVEAFQSDDHFFSEGYNLIKQNDCVITEASNAGTDLLDVDPLLMPLADNGGTTPTRALKSNSPAVDAGACPTVTADQRGLPRRYDQTWATNTADGCDIGAFELQATALTAVELNQISSEANNNAPIITVIIMANIGLLWFTIQLKYRL